MSRRVNLEKNSEPMPGGSAPMRIPRASAQPQAQQPMAPMQQGFPGQPVYPNQGYPGQAYPQQQYGQQAYPQQPYGQPFGQQAYPAQQQIPYTQSAYYQSMQQPAPAPQPKAPVPETPYHNVNPFLTDGKGSFEDESEFVRKAAYQKKAEPQANIAFSLIDDGGKDLEVKLTDEKALKAANEDKKKKAKNKKSGFSLFGKKKTAGKSKAKPTVPYSVQKTIPYRNVYSNGIIEVEEGVFSKTYRVYDVNFSIAPQEEQENIFMMYGDLLNSFGSECLLSLTIHNTNLNQEQFNKDTLIQMKQDGLNEYREEVNNMLIRKVMEGRNNLVHDKYFTVTMPCPSIEEAIVEFSRIDGLVSRNLKAINKQDTQPLTLEERLEVLYNVYNMDSTIPLRKEVEVGTKVIKTLDLKTLNASGVSTKDVIAPPSFEFKRDYFMMGDIYGRSMFVENFPNYIKSSILTDVADLPANLLLTVHFRSMRQDQAIKLVRNQTTNIAANVVTAQKQAAKAGYSSDLISPELQKAQEEARKLMEDITTRNQKLFFVTLVCTHFAMDMETLQNNTKTLESIMQKNLCQIKTLNYLQENGLNTSLPLGVNRLKVERLNTTESASVFIPFSVQEWKQKHGFYYGVNAVSRNMILYNRKQGSNYNGVILGTPGSGKSFSSKREIVNALLSTDDDIYIIDPENEYLPLVEALGGEVVRIAVGGNTYLNPFDMDIEYADQEDPVTLKSDFIGAICEIVIGGVYGLSPIQKSVIDRCVRLVYEPYLNEIKRRRDSGIMTTGDSSIAPTMMEFYRLLLQQEEDEAKQIALALEIYTTGSLNTFAKRTNVNTKNRLVAYDIKDIGQGMKVLGLQICLDAIWNRMIANKRKGKYTWIYIDEAHLLAQHESSAKYVQQVYKRARKWFGIPTIMTQQVEDCLQSKEMRTAISTSNFVMMLNQAPMDKAELGNMFHISDEELTYVTNADPGQGLLYNGKALIPFQDTFPSDTKLYMAMTTKPEDVAKREALKKKAEEEAKEETEEEEAEG